MRANPSTIWDVALTLQFMQCSENAEKSRLRMNQAIMLYLVSTFEKMRPHLITSTYHTDSTLTPINKDYHSTIFNI